MICYKCLKQIFLTTVKNKKPNPYEVFKANLYTPTGFSIFIIVNKHSSNEENGIFSCKINGKPFIIKNMKANLRTITGGHKELSLSNDKFSTFVFINPSQKEIDLTPGNREAFVRYTEPGVHELFKPKKGVIKIAKLDENELILAGEFEMEMTVGDNPAKKIKITEGKLINIPIEMEKK